MFGTATLHVAVPTSIQDAERGTLLTQLYQRVSYAVVCFTCYQVSYARAAANRRQRGSEFSGDVLSSPIPRHDCLYDTGFYCY